MKTVQIIDDKYMNRNPIILKMFILILKILSNVIKVRILYDITNYLASCYIDFHNLKYTKFYKNSMHPAFRIFVFGELYIDMESYS